MFQGKTLLITGGTGSFGNAVLDTDRLENCKPVKRRQTQKIDGVVTMLMCLRLFIDYER